MGLSDGLQKTQVSRRTFLGGMAAVGAAFAVVGCTKDGADDIISTGGGSGSLDGAVEPEDLTNLLKAKVSYATCPHNCGPAVRCVSKPWVVNGRIVRVTTDETETDINGKPRDKEAWNEPRQISCAKGHSYKYRVYHTGRLKYPLKQTVKRGDVTGFVRISWEQAYNEVIRKHRAVFAKYGSAAIQSGANNSSSGTFAKAGDAISPITSMGSTEIDANKTNSGTRGSFSDHSFHQYNYGRRICGVPHSQSYSNNGIGSQIPAVASGIIKNWVSFGTNSMTTNNTLSWPYLRANELAKAANPGFKHYVISPELCDTGVLNATDWVQIRNQTDPALIAAMIYEMLVNTFNPNGTVKTDPWLDVDYIDTCVYGFFDSPEYNINETTGNITVTTAPAGAGERKINAVPSGRSYASWIMGSDNRLAQANYNTSSNYTATAYGNMPRAGLCSLTIKGVPAHSADVNSTKYYAKKDYMTPKTPEWAEKICGTPASVIRELARLYSDQANHPILTEWTGGLQKSENGVLTLFAIQTLFAVTKTWGYSHGSTGGMYQTWASNPGSLGTAPSLEKLPSTPSAGKITVTDAGSKTPQTPSMSCKEHFNGLYFAFKDILDARGFSGKANPYWDGSSRYLNDDAGAKTQILYKRDNTGLEYVKYTDADGREYNDWVGRESGTPVFVGKRFYIGNAGTQFNQIADTNWAAEIFSLLPLAGDNPDDPETFCMSVFDIYMSPQARFADYVFPMANTLEVVDSTGVGGIDFKRLPLATPPGEAKDSWEAAFIGWNEQNKLGGYSAARIDGAPDYNKTIPEQAGYKYIGSTDGKFVSIADKYREIIQEKCNDSSSRFAGMTVDQAIAAQILPKTAQTPPSVTLTTTQLRTNVDNYLAGNMQDPFIKFDQETFPGGKEAQEDGLEHIFISQVSNAMAEFTAASKSGMPASHGKMTCYAEYAVYGWEHAYDIYHGWLPASERGQKNLDYEGDPKIYPIPMYYSFEDAFNEMYGVFNTAKPNRQDGWFLIGSKPATNDISLIKDRLTLTVGSTHDRYRSHSSQAENPYLRELNHRTKGGGWLSGNDWNEYGVVPADQKAGEKGNFSPMISSAIQRKDLATASWHEFWMNDEDAAQFDIKDGDLIRVSNPVGAIRVIARITKRVVRGHGQIHQGAWYDPNPVDGVDDGACANTIMSNRPSKFDNGNAVHCAYCVVEKETTF